METRRLIVAFLAAMAVFYIWTVIASYIWPQRIAATQPAATQSAQTQPAGSTQPAPAFASTQPAGSQPVAAGQPSDVMLVQGSSNEPIHLGSADPEKPYPMELEIQPRGATVSRVRIRDHYESVEKRKPYEVVEPVIHPDAAPLYSFETAKLRFEDLRLDVPLDQAVWNMQTAPEQNAVIGTIEIRSTQGQPLARVIKTYTLPQQKPKSGTFDMQLSIRVQNLTGQPQRVILVQEGPVGFRKEDLRAEDRYVIGGVWNGDTVAATMHVRDNVIKKGKIELGADSGDTRIAWAAESNRYFTCIMAPQGRKGPQDQAKFAVVEAVTLAQNEESAPELSALTYQYITTPRTIPAGGAEDVAFDCYIGPKSKKAFQNIPEYAALDYYGVIKASFAWCAPASLVSLMMRLLDFFHRIPPYNYGLAIIVLVLVVRGILHPITKKSQVNMMKMAKQMAVLQPKIEAVKKKYANDRVQLNQETMKVYQEAGINPAGNLLTCLPLMLQMPIWGALWAALSSTIEMRHAPFDGWWIRDLTSPDALIPFHSPVNIPLISWMTGPWYSFNLLPILLGISQVLQTKYMPRGNTSPSATGAPDQLEQQRKMMMFMSGFFVLMLYNAPSGLNLYIMASNFFGILEQWRIRKHIKEEEERMARGEPPPAGPGGNSESKGPRPPRGPLAPQKTTWFQRKMKEWQKTVEEARRQQSHRDKRGSRR